MELTKRGDVRLLGRAINEGWPVPIELRQKAVDALEKLIDGGDKLSIVAIETLLKASELNGKLTAIDQRQSSGNEDRRLQLLELAKRIPIAELAEIAQGNLGSGDSVDGTAIRTSSGSDEESGGKGEATRPRDSAPEGSDSA